MKPSFDRDLVDQLVPLGPDLWSALLKALEQCLRFQAEDGAWNRRLRANYLWDRANAEFYRLTHGREGIRRLERHGTILYEVGMRFLLRIKKLGDNGRISRIRTQHSDVFFGQGLLFADLDECVNIVVVYKLNATETELAEVAFALCDLSNQVVWKHVIPAPGKILVTKEVVTMGKDENPARVVAKIRRESRRELGS